MHSPFSQLTRSDGLRLFPSKTSNLVGLLSILGRTGSRAKLILHRIIRAFLYLSLDLLLSSVQFIDCLFSAFDLLLSSFLLGFFCLVLVDVDDYVIAILQHVINLVFRVQQTVSNCSTDLLTVHKC